MAALSPMRMFGRLLQNLSISVKSSASKICRISRAKTGGDSIIFLINDRYNTAVAISLTLKASNVFPNREIWLKNGPTSEFL